MVGCERLTQHDAGPVASDEIQGVYFCITYRQPHQQRANKQAKHLRSPSLASPRYSVHFARALRVAAKSS